MDTGGPGMGEPSDTQPKSVVEEVKKNIVRRCLGWVWTKVRTVFKKIIAPQPGFWGMVFAKITEDLVASSIGAIGKRLLLVAKEMIAPELSSVGGVAHGGPTSTYGATSPNTGFSQPRSTFNNSKTSFDRFGELP